jgi:adenine specific DNA methylase Mod
LPIDTKYFKDIEIEILELFDDIDEELDGWLIKSENYQALNTILPKFKKKIQTIYIDPPYNTGNDDFVYKDKFQHSSWLTLMENRLNLARELMKENGMLFVSVDDNELHNLRNLEILEFLANIIRATGSVRNMAKFFDIRHEYLTVFAKNPKKINLLGFERENSKDFQNLDDDPSGEWSLQDLTVRNGGYEYEIPSYDFSKKFKRKWRFSIERMKEEMGGTTNETFEEIYQRAKVVNLDNGKKLIIIGKVVFKSESGIPYYKKYLRDVSKVTPHTLWTDIEAQKKANEDLNENIFTLKVFDNPKPVSLVKKILKLNSDAKSIILDFFAGSGTTAHAVMQLNKEDCGKRKFILIEMADYFYEVIIPRIKKIAYSFNWKDGKPTDADGIGVFVKYYELEQYEEVLRNTKYEHGDLSLQPSPGKDVFNEYIFMRSPKFVEAVLRREGNEYKVDLSKLYPEKKIDIVETLSNVLGKKIKKISKECFELEGIGEIMYDNIPVEYIKPLIWW